MSYAQYLRQLLAPLGVYQLNAPFQGGELEALGDAFDQVEGALEELNREACLATAEDWGLEQVAAASVLPRNRGVGTVDVVVAAGSGHRVRRQRPGGGDRAGRNRGGLLSPGAGYPAQL